MIQKAAKENLIRDGPQIIDLFFADDSLLLCWARMEDLQTIQHILTVYEQAFGQQINREKTMLFFSKVAVEEKKGQILNFLGVLEIK